MGFKAIGGMHQWPWLKRVAMFFDAFFIMVEIFCTCGIVLASVQGVLLP